MEGISPSQRSYLLYCERRYERDIVNKNADKKKWGAYIFLMNLNREKK